MACNPLRVEQTTEAMPPSQKPITAAAMRTNRIISLQELLHYCYKQLSMSMNSLTLHATESMEGNNDKPSASSLCFFLQGQVTIKCLTVLKI